MLNIFNSHGQVLLRRTKLLLTRVGGRLPARTIRGIRLAMNYVYLGYWTRHNGFATPNRVPDRVAVFDSIAHLVGEKQVLYLEFGVYKGQSLAYWSSALKNPESRLHAFDSFRGLPETFDTLTHPIGKFDVGGALPNIGDSRIEFHVGWFEETVPGFELPSHDQLLINLDADLYSSTKLVLDHLSPYIKPGVILYFDDMSRTEHEPAALADFMAENGKSFEMLATDETLNCAALKCIA
jgi:hypothetical protein